MHINASDTIKWFGSRVCPCYVLVLDFFLSDVAVDWRWVGRLKEKLKIMVVKDQYFSFPHPLSLLPPPLSLSLSFLTMRSCNNWINVSEEEEPSNEGIDCFCFSSWKLLHDKWSCGLAEPSDAKGHLINAVLQLMENGENELLKDRNMLLDLLLHLWVGFSLKRKRGREKKFRDLNLIRRMLKGGFLPE